MKLDHVAGRPGELHATRAEVRLAARQAEVADFHLALHSADKGETPRWALRHVRPQGC